jgi:hypothetical protein
VAAVDAASQLPMEKLVSDGITAILDLWGLLA